MRRKEWGMRRSRVKRHRRWERLVGDIEREKRHEGEGGGRLRRVKEREEG